MYLKVGSLIEINNIITGSYNITWKKINVNPYGSDKTYMDKDLIEDTFYQIIDQFNEKKIAPAKILFANDNKINLLYNVYLYSHCIDSGFKKIGNIYEEEVSYSLKILISL